MTNETYTIRAESPLLRPGMSIECRVSSKYVEVAAEKIMELVRVVNKSEVIDGR